MNNKNIASEFSLEVSAENDLLDNLLSQLAVLIEGNDKQSASKYGATYENEVFSFHRYCWCGQEDCPWCTSCTCPPESIHYFIGEKEVDVKEYCQGIEKIYQAMPKRSDIKSFEKWVKKSLTFIHRQKRHTEHQPSCDFCLTGGVAVKFGGEPRLGAPNFWYKPTNFKMWFYKDLGRGTKTVNLPSDEQEIIKMILHCKNSIHK